MDPVKVMGRVKVMETDPVMEMDRVKVRALALVVDKG